MSKVPEVRKADVVVVGAGPAGIGAAVGAARNGADTLLVERYGFVGGFISSGYIAWFAGSHNKKGQQIAKGVFQDLADRMVKLGGSDGQVYIGAGGGSRMVFEPELFKFAALELLEKEGVRLLLHSFVSGVTVEDNLIKGIAAYNKSGRQTIEAKIFVDATGDADIAASGGVPFGKGSEKDGWMNAMSLKFKVGGVDIDKYLRWVQENRPEDPKIHVPAALKEQPSIAEAGYFLTIYSFKEKREVIVNAMSLYKDGTNVDDLTAAEIDARKRVLPIVDFLKKKVPGFENVWLIATAPQTGARETRLIKGGYTLTVNDVKEGKRFKDVIGRGAFPMDIHHPDNLSLIPIESDYDIPYRCLLPKKINNLLVAGRCISVEHEVSGTIRLTVACMVTGQAAGTAAALALKGKVPPGKVDVSKLQKNLVDQGAILYDNQVFETPNLIRGASEGKV